MRYAAVNQIVARFVSCPGARAGLELWGEMEEIEQNAFNLNISRYVSTAEAEEEIDLAATHGELVKIEEKIQAARDRHNKYLKELGLPPLP